MGQDLTGKRIYLSGAMTGLPDWNRQAFAEAANYLRNQGARVLNPAFNAPKDISKADTHESYMIRYLHELTEHMDGKPYYDYLVQLPGWEQSSGAKVEYIVAKACGLEVFTI